MVGASEKQNRPSYFAFKYLLERGYNMIPINPGRAGQELLGRRIYARLADVPEPIDMVDIFRASQFALPIVQEALTLNPRPQVIWMQLGVRNDEAAALAEANGLKVVMKSLSKNRIWPALIRNLLDGGQYQNHLLEKGDGRRHSAHVAESDDSTRRHDRRHRSRPAQGKRSLTVRL